MGVTFNPFKVVSIGTRSELNPPFRFSIVVDHHAEKPEGCPCMWAYRGGKLHLKYVNRLCRHHGGLL